MIAPHKLRRVLGTVDPRQMKHKIRLHSRLGQPLLGSIHIHAPQFVLRAQVFQSRAKVAPHKSIGPCYQNVQAHASFVSMFWSYYD